MKAATTEANSGPLHRPTDCATCGWSEAVHSGASATAPRWVACERFQAKRKEVERRKGRG